MRDIIIITAAFYPHSAVEAVRMTEWARHLPEFGWKPTVLCRNYGQEANRELLDERVSPEVDVIYLNPRPRTLARSSKTLVSRLKRVIESSRIVVPDPALLFWRRQASKIVGIAERIAPACVITSSPPHSIHTVGRHLKSRLNIPWVADFRDPWLIDHRFRPRGIARLLNPVHRYAEKVVYENADLLTYAIPIHHRHTRRRFPETRNRSLLLTNGAPTSLVNGTVTQIKSEFPTSIRIVGSPGSEQQVSIIAEAISGIPNAELVLVGRDPKVTPQLRMLLGDRLSVIGPVSHDKALQYVAGADILVAVLSPSRSASLGLSSKLFEYAVTDQPIVIINPTRSDRRLVRKWERVVCLTSPQVPELQATFIRLAANESSPARPLNERRLQVKQLSHALNRLTTTTPRHVQADHLAGTSSHI